MSVHSSLPFGSSMGESYPLWDRIYSGIQLPSALYFLMNLTSQIHGLLLNPLSNHDALLQLLLWSCLKPIFSRSPHALFFLHLLQNLFSKSLSWLSYLWQTAEVNQHSYSRAKLHVLVTVLTTLTSFLFCLDWKGPTVLSVLSLNGYSKHFNFRRKCMTFKTRFLITVSCAQIF